MKILIIEDDPNFANIIARALGPLASDIRIASNLEMASAELASDAPDVMWVDLFLPDSSGADETLMKIAEAKKHNGDVVTIVMTGAHDYDLPTKAKKSGADAFAEKMGEYGPNQFCSLVLMAAMNARKRGANVADLLAKATRLVSESSKKATSELNKK